MRTAILDHRSSCDGRGGRDLVRVWVLVIFAAATFAPIDAWSDEHAASGADGPRFELTRTADFLFRVDARTGQVWAVPVNGDGGWQPMGGAPESDGAGLYQIAVLPSGRPGLGGPAPRPQLLRTDQVTGRAWLAPASPDGRWTPIAEAPDS
jgi:hypothetical protein